jgi:spoIIIJ-associated protein
MKDSITIRAQTVEEAIHLALEHLGLGPDEVDVRILEEPSEPVGTGEALVLVTRKGAVPAEAPVPGDVSEPSEPMEVGREVLAELLQRMGMQSEVSVGSYALVPEEEQGILEVTTPSERDSGLLIGRRGETLYHLQFILNLLVSRRIHRWPYLLVDVEHYRRRRDASLCDLARRMADRVSHTHQPITLEPMPPYERRVIHIALRQDPLVLTQSTGEGDSRKVVIYPTGWELPPTSSSSAM